MVKIKSIIEDSINFLKLSIIFTLKQLVMGVINVFHSTPTEDNLCSIILVGSS